MTAAVALGAAQSLLYLRGTSHRGAVGGIIHGLTGALGFGLLLLALQGPRHGDAMGAGSFGIVAGVLFGLALVFGPFIRLLTRRAPRAAGLVLATHASVALTGFVLFLAWASL